MVRTSNADNAEMLYAGVSTQQRGTVEIGFRDRASMEDPSVTNVDQVSSTFTIERRGSLVRIFNGSTVLVSRRFDSRELLVGFFATARKSWVVKGSFSDISIDEFGPAFLGTNGINNNGVDAQFSASDLSFWPNPTNNTLNIRFGEAGENVNIEIADLLGRGILRSQLGAVYAGQNVQIDLSRSGIKAGTYTLRVNSKGNTPIFKQFVKND